MNMYRTDVKRVGTYGSGIKVNLAAVVMAMAVVWQVGVTSAQAQAPTMQLSRVVVPAGAASVVTITGAPGQNFALLGSSRNAGFAYGGVNFSVGADLVLLSLGNLDGAGRAVVTVTPPFVGTELDRYYIQVATSPSPAFVPLQVSSGQVLVNGDLAPLAAAGAAGPQGPEGPRGLQGPAGAAGASGPAGAAGATGATGPLGPAGATGAAGALGPQGTQGPTGAAGPAGADGAAGAQGAAGAAGVDGAVGPQGPAGSVGPAGAQGPVGATGAIGAAGPQGPAGAQGPVGATGANGTNGVDGAAGATGAQGPAGATGADGATGATGATGAQGPAGANGTNGVDGAVGPQGPAGAVGPQGPAGTDGVAGSQGPAGPVGPAGAQGPAGTNGLNGGTGPQGPVGPGADGWANITAAAVPNISTTDVILATINLPAGSYLLAGKVSIARTTGNGTSVCTLNNGATVLDQTTNQGTPSGETPVVQAPLTLAVAGPTAITMRCRSVNGTQATTSTASFRTLSAYRLNTLTVQ